MKYTKVFDLCQFAMNHMRRAGWSYPEGTARKLALLAIECTNAFELIDVINAEMERVGVRRWPTNPRWDGSIA